MPVAHPRLPRRPSEPQQTWDLTYPLGPPSTPHQLFLLNSSSPWVSSRASRTPRQTFGSHSWVRLPHPPPRQVHQPSRAPSSVSPRMFSRVPAASVSDRSLLPPSWVAATISWGPSAASVCASPTCLQVAARELFLGKPVPSQNSPAWNAPFAACPLQKNGPVWPMLTPWAPSPPALPHGMPSTQPWALLSPALCCASWVAHSASLFQLWFLQIFLISAWMALI